MIVPSVDLMNGKAVQLIQGKDKALERENPLQLAQEFNRYAEIAAIDLDAAMGSGDNRALIKEICSVCGCRVGGGIASAQQAKEIISYGARKVIIGTKAFENDRINHAFLAELAEAAGPQRIVIAVDSAEGHILTRAWKHDTGLKTAECICELEQYAAEFLFTCVKQEGGMKGTDMKAILELNSLTKSKITAAGGITSVDELRQLAAAGIDAQLGMALYTGRLALDEGVIESLDWSKGLIPTIVKDESGQALMLAYSSRSSLKKAFAAGRMTYFSRSRQELWTKGDTSGHYQELVSVRTDCDSDALLVTVRQHGPACHTNEYSCFGEKEFGLEELYSVILSRFAGSGGKKSYTATLTDEKVREKLMEEAQEVIEAETDDEIIWEAADVLYFLTVLLAKSGISLSRVLTELKRRRRLA